MVPAVTTSPAAAVVVIIMALLSVVVGVQNRPLVPSARGGAVARAFTVPLRTTLIKPYQGKLREKCEEQ